MDFRQIYYIKNSVEQIQLQVSINVIEMSMNKQFASESFVLSVICVGERLSGHKMKVPMGKRTVYIDKRKGETTQRSITEIEL